MDSLNLFKVRSFFIKSQTHLFIATLNEDPTQTLAHLFAYAIDGRALETTAHALFGEHQKNNHLSAQKLVSLLAKEGLSNADTSRVLNLLSIDKDAQVDFTKFNKAENVVFTEAMSLFLFSWIFGKPPTSPTDGVTFPLLRDGMYAIWSKLGKIYPQPKSEELESLFNQADKSGDGRLNISEFHTFLTNFLKYYRAGILNNIFARIVFNDLWFQDLWNKQKKQDADVQIEFLKASFFKFLQLSLHDKTRAQAAYEIFLQIDTNGSGSISPKELENVL